MLVSKCRALACNSYVGPFDVRCAGPASRPLHEEHAFHAIVQWKYLPDSYRGA